MSDGRILKPDKDYTTDVDKQIPEAQELAKVSQISAPVPAVLAIIICLLQDNLQAAIEKLSGLEKHTRQVRALSEFETLNLWTKARS